MNTNRKKAAIAKYSAMASEDFVKYLKADEKNYTEEEIEELIPAIVEAAKDPAATPPVEVAPAPNKPDLSGFDYKKLTGDSFKKYVELVGDRSFKVVDDMGNENPIVGELKENDQYDFVQYRAVPVRKPRFPGVKDTPFDFVGITLKNDTPEHTTRIPVRVALEHNAQILNAHSIAGHGKYYLLRKG